MKIFYGEENYLINQEIINVAKMLDIKPTIFNEDDSLENILMDITTVSMFFDKKLIVIKNHSALSNANDSKKIVADIQNLDASVSLIFVFEDSKLPKSSLVDFVQEHGEIKEFKRLSEANVVATIKDIVTSKGGSISNSATIKLAGKVPNDLRIIILEIEKLLSQTNEISDENVEISIGEYVKDNAFGFANALSNNDAHAILAAYNESRIIDDEPTYLIGQISSVLSLSLQVDSLRRQGLSNQDISNQTKIHIFRIKKASDLIAKTSIEKIKLLVVRLAQLDADIKTGKIDDRIGLENFILQVIR